MKTKIVIALIAIAGMLGLAGCKPTTTPPATTTLTGQVFIVTQGAQNIKLGDVEILLIDKTNVANFIQGKQAKIESEIEAKKLQITNANQMELAALQAFNDALHASLNPPYETNADYLELKAHLAVVSQLEDKFADQNLSLLRQIGSGGEKGMDTTALEQQQVVVEQNWETETNVEGNLQKELDAIKAPANDQASQLCDTAGLNFTNTEAEVERLQSALDNFPSAEDYFNDFSPVASQETKTDADGKFSVSYPRDKSFTIFATAQRVILNQTETYYWLVDAPTGTTSAQILLSNDNLVYVDPDGYFKLKPKPSP